MHACPSLCAALAAAHAYHQVIIVFPSAYLALLFLLLGEALHECVVLDRA